MLEPAGAAVEMHVVQQRVLHVVQRVLHMVHVALPKSFSACWPAGGEAQPQIPSSYHMRGSATDTLVISYERLMQSHAMQYHIAQYHAMQCHITQYHTALHRRQELQTEVAELRLANEVFS